MNRRNLLKATALVPAVVILARCGASAATVDAQIVADVQGLQSETGSLIAALNAYDPTAVSVANQQKITQAEAALIAAAQALSASTPVATGATTLQQIDGYLNTILSVIGAALPAASVAFPPLAPFVVIYDAAVALLPGLEAYINSLVPATAPTAGLHPGVAAIKRSYTPDQARAVLGIKKVN